MAWRTDRDAWKVAGLPMQAQEFSLSQIAMSAGFASQRHLLASYPHG
jgi:hypothetical protein